MGAVGKGCGLELDEWLQPGDVIELEVEGIGILRNLGRRNHLLEDGEVMKKILKYLGLRDSKARLPPRRVLTGISPRFRSCLHESCIFPHYPHIVPILHNPGVRQGKCTMNLYDIKICRTNPPLFIGQLRRPLTI